MPIILIATVVLSFVAAFGISAIVFTHIFGFAGTDAGLPLFAFVFLVALGIDYNITSAGLVLAGTFAVSILLTALTLDLGRHMVAEQPRREVATRPRGRAICPLGHGLQSGQLNTPVGVMPIIHA